MNIQSSIIQTVFDTLKNESSLKPFVNDKKDIYKGFPTTEQNSSKNYIVIEPKSFETTDSLSVNKKQVNNFKYRFQINIHVGFTADHPSATLEKFLEFTTNIINSIDTSVNIQQDDNIYGFRLISKTDEPFFERILLRESVIVYEFIGTYKQGNL